MSIEQAAQRPSTNEIPQPKEQSIFDFYSVESEMRFVQELHNLPEEEKIFYIKENVLRFLGEFVGKVPYTKISYMLTPEGMEFAGIKMTPVYEKATSLTDGSSRETAEWIGYRKIEKQLLQGTPGMTWISPPIDADYGFVFHFQKDPNSEQVNEYILRYNENQGDVSRSQEISHSLHSSLTFRENPTAFLKFPLTTSEPDLTLRALLNNLNIDDLEIERSTMFEEEVKKRMTYSIKNDYFQAIVDGNEEKAKELLTAFYNWAKRIKQELDAIPPHLFKEVYKKPTSTFDGELQKALAYFSVQKATIVGGGSCPVTRAGNSTPLSSWNIYQNLQRGLPIETTLNQQTCEACQGDKSSHFHCPGCAGSIESGKGIETCPHCNLNKDDYAKQTGVSC